MAFKTKDVGSVYFASWIKSTGWAILTLAIGWNGHKTNLEHMTCLVEQDICNNLAWTALSSVMLSVLASC